MSYGFWSLIYTYPLLSDGRNRSAVTAFFLHVSSLKWKEVSLCYSCSRKLPRWDPVERGRQTQAIPAGPKGGKWPGGMRRERGMEWDDLNGNNHNFYGKSWAGQTREKGRWRVKERQGSQREGEANGAKRYQAQAGRVQPSPFLLWLTPITCKLSWLRIHFHLWRAGKCPLEHINAAVLQAVCLLWGQGIDMSQVWQTPGVLPCAPFFVQRCLYPEL